MIGQPGTTAKVDHFNNKVNPLQSLDEQSQQRNLRKRNESQPSGTGRGRGRQTSQRRTTVGDATTGFAKDNNMTNTAGEPGATTGNWHFNNKLNLLQSLDEQSQQRNLRKCDESGPGGTGTVRRSKTSQLRETIEGSTMGLAKGSNMTYRAGNNRLATGSHVSYDGANFSRLAKASMWSYGGGYNPRLVAASQCTSLMENNMGIVRASQMAAIGMSDMNQLQQMRPMGMDRRNQMNQMFELGIGAAQQQLMGMMQQQPMGMIRQRPMGMMQQQPMGMMQPQPMGMMQQQLMGMMQQQPMGMIQQRQMGMMQQQPMGMMQMQQPLMEFGTGIGAEMMGMGNCWL